MKYIKSALALFIAIILLSSCQKEISGELITSKASGSSTTSTNSAKVKTYTEDVTTSAGHSAITFNLTYDSNDRQLSMISTISPGDKFVYQYSSNNTYTMDLFNSNQVSIHELVFLNHAGLIDSTFKYNDTNDTSTEKYLYNSANQLVTYREFDYTTAQSTTQLIIHTTV